MEINKKQIFETFLMIMRGIADKNYQKRVWILGEGPEVDDFDETYCHFTQEAEGIIENYRDFDVTEDQVKLLTKFQEKLESFSDENYLPEEFIDTPEWDKITKMAKEVLEAFDYKKYA